jgi:hypothetical protein
MLEGGTELVGVTKKHPGRIVIIGMSDRKYRIEYRGGQHKGKAVEYLSKSVIEAHYRISKHPRKKQKKEEETVAGVHTPRPHEKRTALSGCHSCRLRHLLID